MTVFGVGQIHHFNATDGTLMSADVFSDLYTTSSHDFKIDSTGTYAFVSGTISGVNGYCGYQISTRVLS